MITQRDLTYALEHSLPKPIEIDTEILSIIAWNVLKVCVIDRDETTPENVDFWADAPAPIVPSGPEE